MKPYAMAWVRNGYRLVFEPKATRKKGKDLIKVLYRGNGKIVKNGKHYRQAIIEKRAILTYL